MAAANTGTAVSISTGTVNMASSEDVRGSTTTSRLALAPAMASAATRAPIGWRVPARLSWRAYPK
jgi:hypothetical protein